MGKNRAHRKRNQHRTSTETGQGARSRLHTSPDAEGAQELDYWQPERLSLKAGIQSLSWFLRAFYLLIICGTLFLNIYAFPKLPEEFSMLHWFGYSSVMVNSIFYLIFAFCLILFLVYRDVVNRSVSRRKVFIPLIFFLGNYYIILTSLLRRTGNSIKRLWARICDCPQARYLSLCVS